MKEVEPPQPNQTVSMPAPKSEAMAAIKRRIAFVIPASPPSVVASACPLVGRVRSAEVLHPLGISSLFSAGGGLRSPCLLL